MSLFFEIRIFAATLSPSIRIVSSHQFFPRSPSLRLDAPCAPLALTLLSFPRSDQRQRQRSLTLSCTVTPTPLNCSARARTQPAATSLATRAHTQRANHAKGLERSCETGLRSRRQVRQAKYRATCVFFKYARGSPLLFTAVQTRRLAFVCVCRTNVSRTSRTSVSRLRQV